MAIVHIVLFRLSKELDEAGQKEFCDDMLALRGLCKHKDTNEPYIVASSGGKDNSPEGQQGGFTHGFVVEFASLADRDYYVSADPAHQAFVRKNSGKFEDARVIDYQKGLY